MEIGQLSSSPYIIVIGNEKGGTGKSTVSMHLIVSLLHQNFVVGSIDVDARQGSLTRYMENRRNYAAMHSDQFIPLSCHEAVFRSQATSISDSEAEEEDSFTQALNRLQECQVVVIDTPGTDSYLSRLAHSYADTLVTPMNDSFVDLDMLARVEENTIRPSKYAEMVWEQKKNKALRNGGSIDWIILRNRLSSLNARNKEEVEKIVSALAKRIGVRAVNGFGERVIFRELFLQGLTLLDLKEAKNTPSLSHIAARQELKSLVEAIRLPLS